MLALSLAVVVTVVSASTKSHSETSVMSWPSTPAVPRKVIEIRIVLIPPAVSCDGNAAGVILLSGTHSSR